jgi:hypothetical protein
MYYSLCGHSTSIDPHLPGFAADLEWLKNKGVHVERYNLAQEVGAFTSNPVVKAILNSEGTKCLPLVLVDGAIVSQATYPARKTLAGFVGLVYEPEPVVTEESVQPSLVSIGRLNVMGKR